MFPEPVVDSDVKTNVCISCGYEDYQRKEFDHAAVLEELRSESRSQGSVKRPIHEWE